MLFGGGCFVATGGLARCSQCLVGTGARSRALAVWAGGWAAFYSARYEDDPERSRLWIPKFLDAEALIGSISSCVSDW